MTKKTCFLLVAFCIFAIQPLQSYAAEDITAEQLIAAHLKSIGSPALRAKVKSLTFGGTSTVKFIQGIQGTSTGVSMLVSEGPKMGIILKFPDKNNYPGEYFAYDGKDVTVGHIRPGVKSPIADFVFRFHKIMKEGLVGGVYSTAWPLLNIKDKASDLKCRKTKIENRELYELEYRPSDPIGYMKIKMYFDPATFRHVRTEYKVRTNEDVTTTANPAQYDPSISSGDIVDDPSGRGRIISPDKVQQIAAGDFILGKVRGESIYILTEKFDDFKKIGGLTMPHRYELDYEIEGTAQSGFIANWTLEAQQWGFNMANLDEKLFQAEK